MSEPARDDEADLTPEERAQIRALLRLLRRAAKPAVDQPAPKQVRPPSEKAFEQAARWRRRAGRDNG